MSNSKINRNKIIVKLNPRQLRILPRYNGKNCTNEVISTDFNTINTTEVILPTSVEKSETTQVNYDFKEEYVPVSPEGFNRCFMGLEGLPIIDGSYKSPNEVRHLVIIIPFRDGPEKVREEQLYIFLHHTIQYLVQQNSSFTIVLSNQSGRAILSWSIS